MIHDVISQFPGVSIPVVDGDFKLVYEPDPDKPNSWMVNDHCLIRDDEGVIHYFGIENPFPTTAEALEISRIKDLLKPSQIPFITTLHGLIHGHLYRPGTHFRVGHAVAKNIWGPWKRLPAALGGNEEPKNSHGSPFVIKHSCKYWMFEPTGGEQATGIYTSSDLSKWQPITDASLWQDASVFGPQGHRDPCIIPVDDGTFLQYYAGDDQENRNTIGLASSRDLKNWKAEFPCYIENIPKAIFSGMYESPYVVERQGLYYLFVGFSHRHYYETFVVVSDNPYSFNPQHKVTTLFSHAAEFELVQLCQTLLSHQVNQTQLVKFLGMSEHQVKLFSLVVFYTLDKLTRFL